MRSDLKSGSELREVMAERHLLRLALANGCEPAQKSEAEQRIEVGAHKRKKRKKRGRSLRIVSTGYMCPMPCACSACLPKHQNRPPQF
jgi:hypothetical protein